MTIERDEDGTRIICSGEFNAARAIAIEQLLGQSMTRRGQETLVLTHVTTMDITGIRLAYAWRRALELQNRNAKVVLPASGVIGNLLERTGIAKLF
ncbi:STAS domain-containing protein [Pseudochryseolinea flava]|nr:STAS domain-containing protein [Pseudochryseolinea flava]